MTGETYNKAKVYVCEFPNSNQKPRIVTGWAAVLELRQLSSDRVCFRAFHTYDAAEAYMLKLRNLR